MPFFCTLRKERLNVTLNCLADARRITEEDCEDALREFSRLQYAASIELREEFLDFDYKKGHRYKLHRQEKKKAEEEAKGKRKEMKRRRSPKPKTRSELKKTQEQKDRNRIAQRKLKPNKSSQTKRRDRPTDRNSRNLFRTRRKQQRGQRQQLLTTGSGKYVERKTRLAASSIFRIMDSIRKPSGAPELDELAEKLLSPEDNSHLKPVVIVCSKVDSSKSKELLLLENKVLKYLVEELTEKSESHKQRIAQFTASQTANCQKSESKVTDLLSEVYYLKGKNQECAKGKKRKKNVDRAGKSSHRKCISSSETVTNQNYQNTSASK
ncbi:hypothetical protein ElyMa_001684800 [Elysia marginata]|uniref:Uncharacterized protein n=1 Tax=Elysia marginata TaxID=1093978 RepID=A0AAV4JUZ6_9GAST|nr:hypothetical protein ElyMa_001684800 [Elysia marginata]